MPNQPSSKFRTLCKVRSNFQVAPGHFVLTLESAKISSKALPGQFVQILCEDSYEPFLPRPFSFLTTTKKEFSILYHVVGKGTKILSSKKKGEKLWILGPLGNGFTLDHRLQTTDYRSESAVFGLQSQVLLVGGGVGIPPLYHLAQFLVKKINPSSIHVYLGARDRSLLLCEKEFQKLKVNLKVATDNGSKGLKGLVTDLLEEKLYGQDTSRMKIYTCGPTPMLKAVSSVAQKYEVPCEVSVEVPMACGFGACLGCAIKVRPQTKPNSQSPVSSQSSSSSYRYAIACSEGPVFGGDQIVWD